MINSLTKQQVLKMPEYVEKYTQYIQNTQPFELDEIVPKINALYTRLLGQDTVPVLLAKGPKEAWKAVQYLQQSKATSYTAEDIQGFPTSNFSSPYLCGALDANAIAFYDFFHHECGIVYDVQEKYDIWASLVEYNYIFPLEHVCVVVQRPKAVHLVEGVLHNANGPSIEYKDDLKVYSLNGIRVPAFMVEKDLDAITVEDYHSITNAEVKQEFVKRVGPERFFKLLGVNPAKALKDFKTGPELYSTFKVGGYYQQGDKMWFPKTAKLSELHMLNLEEVTIERERLEFQIALQAHIQYKLYYLEEYDQHMLAMTNASIFNADHYEMVPAWADTIYKALMFRNFFEVLVKRGEGVARLEEVTESGVLEKYESELRGLIAMEALSLPVILT